MARELPGIEVDGRGQWSAKVRGKLVAWERPLRELLTGAWLGVAPKRVVKEWRSAQPG